MLPLLAAIAIAAGLAGCSARRDRVEPLPPAAPFDDAAAPPETRDGSEAGRTEADLAERAHAPAAVPPALVHVVAPGETLWRIARRYGVGLALLARANDVEDPARIAVGRRLVIPGRSTGGAIEPPGANAAVLPAGGLAWPVEGRVSSGFGAPRGRRVHKGIDILVPDGTPVVAVEDGTVRYAGWRGAYGRLVILDHDGGLATYYAHNSKLLVREGERVDRGQPIAASGRSGNASAPHLHFELRLAGTPVNPLEHFPR